MNFTLALAQIDPVPCDLKRNIRTHIDRVRRARDGGADLVVFPELSLTGYTLKDAVVELALRSDGGGALDELVEACGDATVIAGGVEESTDFGIYNAAFALTGSGARVVHRKIYPPSYGMFEEQRYFLRGGTVSSFESPVGTLGVLICEDLWHLPLPYLLAKDGAPVIIAIAASPTRVSGSGGGLRNEEVNGENHRTLARLLSTYLCFCNRVGVEDGVNFWGGSSVQSPDGNTVVRARLFEEDLVFAEIDLAELRRARMMSRHFLDDDPHLTRRELARILGKPGSTA